MPANIDWKALEDALKSKYTPEEGRRLYAQLLRLVPPTQRFENGRLVPRLNQYITNVIFKGKPLVFSEKQTRFLMSPAMEVFYGGAAGGGKSVALLASAAQFVDVPGYSALVVRKTFSELRMSGALMDMAEQWWGAMPGVRRRDGGKSWEFETGGPPAKIEFGFLESSEDKRRYQSAEFHSIDVDEVTEFKNESDFTFLFSRLRAPPMGVPLRMRSASNPNGPGKGWVKGRYVDEETRGERVFVPSTIDDNPFMPEREVYKRNLAEELGPIESAQLLHGDWEAQAAGKFRRHWFKVCRVVPAGTRFVRYWDLAATEDAPGKDPSYTAGALVGFNKGEYYIADMRRARLSPKGVEDLVRQTAQVDGFYVPVRMEQEPGSAGVNVINYYTKALAGYDFKGDKVTGPRELRANGLAAQAEPGNVSILAGDWNKAFLDEVEIFPGGGHDDQVIAACGAFNELANVPRVDTKRIIMVGERIRPDW